MNRKDLLLFIGQCLTLRHDLEKVQKIKTIMESGEVDWEQLNWLASNHLIIPSLYINLKLSGLLKSLPEDLVDHFENITELNRQRNKQILAEINQISGLLNKYSIKPIYLKGTAHLLNVLYADIGERMIGDIDFLVEPLEMKRTGEILIENGYVPLRMYEDDILLTLKHYPRLTNENKVAAVEVHQNVLRERWEKDLGFNHINPSKIQLKLSPNTFIPSIGNQILHNILNTQLNDAAYKKYYFNFRQIYDLFLLSKLEDSFGVITEYGKYFQVLNTNLALSSMLLNDSKYLKFEADKKVELFIKKVFYYQNHPKQYRNFILKKYFITRLTNYFSQIVKSFYDSKTRKRNIAKLVNPQWYIQHIKSYRKIK